MKQFIAAIALFTIIVSTWGQTNYYSQTKMFHEKADSKESLLID